MVIIFFTNGKQIIFVQEKIITFEIGLGREEDAVLALRKLCCLHNIILPQSKGLLYMCMIIVIFVMNDLETTSNENIE